MTTLYSHSARPDWGTAQLIKQEGEKRAFLFWNGEVRTFGKSHWHLMVPVEGTVVDPPTKATQITLLTPDEKDLRALRLQSRILGDSVTKKLYDEAVTNTPKEGFFGNTGRNIVRDVLEAWLVGEYELVAPGLARAIEFLEHGLKVEERWGGDSYLFYRALHAQSLGLAHWLAGNGPQSQKAFLASADAEVANFEANEKQRRTELGSLHLTCIAAGNPQRGLDVAAALSIPKPRAHPEDFKTQRQNRYYDAYGRTLKTLAEDLVQGKQKRVVHDKAMKCVAKELAENMSRADYLFVDIPRHIVWMKIFACDLLGIKDPKITIARLYLLAPSVRRPASIAQHLAGQTS